MLESKRVTPDFVRYATVAPGAIIELRENIAALTQLTGSRRKVLSAISEGTGIPVPTIESIVRVPEVTVFSAFRNPLSGEPLDLADLLPDPNANTAGDAIERIYNDELGRVLEEVMSS